MALRAQESVPVGKFPSYVEERYTQKTKGEDVFNVEFQALVEDAAKLAGTETGTSQVAFSPTNMIKNRAKDFVPFDHNRVVLPTSDQSTGDYINASHIKMCNGTANYIAAQAPTEDTIADFWRMVACTKATVIVDLCDQKEGGAMCEYWKGEAAQSVGLEVKMHSQHDYEDFTLTTLSLTEIKTGTSTWVYHLHYLTWQPGCPARSSEVLVEFVQFIAHYQSASSGPLIVHGTGRAGVLIGLDVLRHTLKDQGEKATISMYEMVLQLRHQRSKIIQSVTEYRYLYSLACIMIHANFSHLLPATSSQDTSAAPVKSQPTTTTTETVPATVAAVTPVTKTIATDTATTDNITSSSSPTAKVDPSPASPMLPETNKNEVEPVPSQPSEAIRNKTPSPPPQASPIHSLPEDPTPVPYKDSPTKIEATRATSSPVPPSPHSRTASLPPPFQPTTQPPAERVKSSSSGFTPASSALIEDDKVDSTVHETESPNKERVKSTSSGLTPASSAPIEDERVDSTVHETEGANKGAFTVGKGAGLIMRKTSHGVKKGFSIFGGTAKKGFENVKLGRHKTHPAEQQDIMEGDERDATSPPPRPRDSIGYVAPMATDFKRQSQSLANPSSDSIDNIHEHDIPTTTTTTAAPVSPVKATEKEKEKPTFFGRFMTSKPKMELPKFAGHKIELPKTLGSLIDIAPAPKGEEVHPIDWEGVYMERASRVEANIGCENWPALAHDMVGLGYESRHIRYERAVGPRPAPWSRSVTA